MLLQDLPVILNYVFYFFSMDAKMFCYLVTSFFLFLTHLFLVRIVQMAIPIRFLTNHCKVTAETIFEDVYHYKVATTHHYLLCNYIVIAINILFM